MIKTDKDYPLIPEEYFIKDLTGFMIYPDEVITNFAYQTTLSILPEVAFPTLGAGYSLLVEPYTITETIKNPKINLKGFETIKEEYTLNWPPSDITWVSVLNLNRVAKNLVIRKSNKKIKGKPQKASADSLDYLNIGEGIKASGSSAGIQEVDNRNGFSKGMQKVADALSTAASFLATSSVLGNFSPELQGVLAGGLKDLSADFQQISNLSDTKSVSMKSLMQSVYSPENGSGLSAGLENFSPLTTTTYITKVPKTTEGLGDGDKVVLDINELNQIKGMPDLSAEPVIPKQVSKEEDRANTHYRAGSVFGSNLGKDQSYTKTSDNWYSFFEGGTWTDSSGSQSSQKVGFYAPSQSFKLFTFPDFGINKSHITELKKPEVMFLKGKEATPELNPTSQEYWDAKKKAEEEKKKKEAEQNPNPSTAEEPSKDKETKSNTSEEQAAKKKEEEIAKTQKNAIKSLSKTGIRDLKYKDGNLIEVQEPNFTSIIKKVTDRSGKGKWVFQDLVPSFNFKKPKFWVSDEVSYSLYTLLENFDDKSVGNFQFKWVTDESGNKKQPEFYSYLHYIILDQQVQQQFYVAWLSYITEDGKEIPLELGSDYISNYFLLMNNFQFSPVKRGSFDFEYHFFKTSFTSSKPEGNNEFSFKLPLDIGLQTWKSFLEQGLKVGFTKLPSKTYKTLIPGSKGNFFTDKDGNSRQVDLHIVMPSFQDRNDLNMEDLSKVNPTCNHLILQNIKLFSGSDLPFSQSGNNVGEFTIKGIFKRAYLIRDQVMKKS